MGGRYALWKIRREEKRLAGGWTYEPPTFYEQNEAAQRLASPDGPQAKLSHHVICHAPPKPHSDAAKPGSRLPATVG